MFGIGYWLVFRYSFFEMNKMSNSTLKEIKLDYNKRVAVLQGWTNIIAVGGSLLGRPEDGAPNSRGQAMIPDYCGDWNATASLMALMDHVTADDIVVDNFVDSVFLLDKPTSYLEAMQIYIVTQYLYQMEPPF